MQEPIANVRPAATLRLLGGFSLTDAAGRELAFPYDKAKLLLAILVLQPAGLARERAAEMLWPRSTSAQARANLRRALFDLKQAIAALDLAQADALEADRRQLRFGAAAEWQIDTRRFAETLPTDGGHSVIAPTQALAIEAQLALYRGPLLDGVPLGDTEADGWVAAHRDALAALAKQRRQQVLDWHLASGRHDAALRHAQAALALDPLCEPSLQSGMRALAQTDRLGAIALFEAFQDRLRSTLGVAPSASTLALFGSLKSPARPIESGPDPVRRRVVALVCELDVAHDDPELLAKTLEPVQTGLASRLRTLGAHVQREDGGELVAFFGHPHAMEQAPRRALMSAIAVRDQATAPLSLRIGVHAGWAYAGQPHASPDSGGLLSRRARALATQAQPGDILVSQDVRMLAPRDFKFEQLGPHQARFVGMAQEMPTERQAMVGREAELAQLLRFVHQSTPGPSVAFVQGEPGIGKSRLLEAVADGSGLMPAEIRSIAFQPEAGHTPYGPFVATLRQRLARHDGDVEDLLSELGLVMPAHQQVLARLVGGATASVDTHKREDEELLCALLASGAAAPSPRLVLIEDLHWADPSSLDLLGRCLQMKGLPLRFVLSSRAPLPSILRPGTTISLLLAPLGADAMTALIRQLDVADGPTAQHLLARAEGVPLFAEELARAIRTAPDEPLPASLWDLLAARLDAIGTPARRLAQSAAIIGIDFDLELLQAAHPFEASQGAGIEQLGRLAAAGLLDLLAPEPSGALRWRFRHALMRDAVYASTTLQRREELHRRVADALLGPCAGLVADNPELLAHHLSAAGDPLAAHYWLTAGKNAAALSGHAEACQAFERGLRSVAPTASRLALSLWLSLGTSQLALQGYGSSAARHSFGQALALADAAAESGGRFQALWGLWLGSRSGQDEEAPLASAHRLVDEAQRDGDQAACAQAAYALGNNLFFAGRLEDAADWLQRAVALAAPLTAGTLVQRFGEHGGITAQAMLGWLLAVQGRGSDAVTTGEAALRASRVLGHAPTQAFSLAMLAVLHRHLNQPSAAGRWAKELLAFATAHELQLWQAVGGLVLGWSMAAAGDDSGLAPIRQAVAASAQAMPSTEATFIAFLVDALLALGRAEEALPWIEDALTKAQQRQETYLLPSLMEARAMARSQLRTGEPIP